MQQAGKQVITHVMEPVLPGACAVVMVGGATAATRVFGFRLADGAAGSPGSGRARAADRRVPLRIAQRTGECLTVRIPKGRHSAWAVQLGDRFDPSAAWIANRPRLDWAFPADAEAGGELRLMGRNLVSVACYPTKDPEDPVSYGGLLRGKTRVVARAAGGQGPFVRIPVTLSSAYEARLTLPASLQPGVYDCFAHNGLGGPAGWSAPVRVAVKPAEAWPRRVFRVDAFRRRHPDLDAAVTAALRAVAANGGGILEFGPETYRLRRTIVVPPRTVVRGASWRRTRLEAAMGGDFETGPFIVITGDRDFVVKDLSILSVYAPVLICAPAFTPQTFDEAARHNFWDDRRARNVTIRGCKLAQKILLNHDRRRDMEGIQRMRAYATPTDDDSLGGGMRLTAVVLRGDDLAVEDNIVLGGGSCVSLTGCRSVRVSRNQLTSGPCGHSLVGSSRLSWPADRTGARIEGNYCRDIIAEDNVMNTRSIMGRAIFYLTYGGENALIARNRIQDIDTTYDGEACGLHLWMARWTKPRIRMTGPTSAEIEDPQGEVAHEWLEGAVLDVVDGRGVGQMRRIVRREGNWIELENPWLAEPDASSRLVFTAPPPFRNIVMADNEIHRTGSNIICWGCSNDIILDGNRCSEGAGIQVWSVRISASQKVWGGAAFSTVIHNVMSTGGTIGIPCGAAADCTTDGYDILGYVARGNVTRDNAVLHIQTTQARSNPDGTSLRWPLHHAGLVVEGNLSLDSGIGISVERGARAVVRGNRACRVKKPLVRPPPASSGPG